MCVKYFKLLRVSTLVCSIAVDGALTLCAFLYFLYDLKALKMNVQRRLIRKFLLYEFEMGYDVNEAAKNNC